MLTNGAPSAAVVVNHDAEQLHRLTELLREVGLTPQGFTNAEDALKAIDPYEPPDVVVTNIYMPGIDGWQFCRLLRSPEYEAFNPIPILVTSATYAGEEPERIARDLGAEVFLPAPVDAHQFIDAVEAILRGEHKKRLPRILVVEDSVALTRLLEEVFTRHGYQVDCAHTLRDAEAALGGNTYEVAVLDYHLPDGLSDSLLDTIQVLQEGCVVIMMTSDPGSVLALDWMNRGAAAYLRKPFEAEYLIELCARARRERALLRSQHLLDQRSRDLRESEEKYRNLVENLNEIIYILDEKAVITYITPNIEAIGGYTQDEVLGRSFLDFVHPDDKQGRIEQFTKVLSGIYDPSEYRYLTKEGHTIWVRTAARPIMKEGRLAGVQGVLTDITDRKEAEQTIAHERRMLRTIIDNLPHAIYAKDAEGRKTLTNPADLENIGRPEAEVLGKTDFELFPPDVAARFWANDQKVLRAGESVINSEEMLQIQDGVQRYLLTSKLPLRDEGEEIIGLVGVGLDITRRKQAEVALRESEERFRSITENAFDLIAIIGLDGVYLYCNSRHIDVLGYAPETLLGKNCFDLIHLDDRERAQQIFFEGLRAGNQSEILEIRALCQDGGQKWIHIRARLMNDGNGKPCTVFLTGQDITEHKRAEEELRRRESQLQKVFEILPVGLWFADKDGTLLRGNPAGVRIWGGEPKVSISEYGVFKSWRLPSRELIAPDDWALARTIREGVTIVDELLEIEAIDGTRKTILNYTTPILDDTGTIDGAIVVNLDISDRMALEAQLAQSQKMESIGRLAGGVAHDFNNMLGAILGQAELILMQEDLEPALQDSLHEIRNAAERSADLTRQLLAFARKQTVSPKVLDLNQTVGGMLKMLTRLIGEDIDLVWAPRQGLWTVSVDPSQIDQILANLCVNARDAVMGVGKITIETNNVTFDEEYCASNTGFLPGDYVLLAVSDNGSGMDKKVQDHLFEPFFTTKDVGKGTGLGLATVYGIVKQNDGFINVYSEPGQGTTFRIYLPCHVGKAEQRRTEKPAEVAEFGPKTILLVEDEPAILNIGQVILRKLGFEVLSAATPGEAIELARNHPGDIHLLITDVVMPEMNGRELAKNIMSIYPNLKRLFMSGYTANVIAHHGILDAGVHFIQKPFAIKDLAAKIHEALDSD